MSGASSRSHDPVASWLPTNFNFSPKAACATHDSTSVGKAKVLPRATREWKLQQASSQCSCLLNRSFHLIMSREADIDRRVQGLICLGNGLSALQRMAGSLSVRLDS